MLKQTDVRSTFTSWLTAHPKAKSRQLWGSI